MKAKAHFVTPLLCFAFCAAVFASPASAAKAPIHDIGTFASGTASERFNAPRGIAVNNSGNGGVPAGTIYVADSANNRIQAFDANGSFLRAWGWDTIGVNEVQAVDRRGATGGTYTLSFDPDGVGPLPSDTTTPLAFNALFSPAVRDAVASLDGIGTGNVAVSGGSSNPRVITFQSALATTDIQQLTCDGTNLTYGTPTGSETPPDPPCVVTTIADGFPTGATGFEICAVDATCKNGATGTGAGQFSSGGARGVAVNQTTGDVYVFDPVNQRVLRFDATGHFIASWGSNGTGAGQFATTTATPGIATDSSGNVYVADPGNRRVQKFGPTGTFERMAGWDVVETGPGDDVTAPEDEFEVCIASNGDVCKAGAASGAGDGRFTTNHPSFLAVSPAGDVYAVDATAPGKIVRLNSSLGLADAEFAPTVVSAGGELRAIAVKAPGGNVFFSKATDSNIYEVDPATELKVAEHPAGATNWLGLALNEASGRMYAASGNTAAGTQGHVVRILDEGTFPSAVSTPATGNTGLNATLNGTVDPNGVELTSCAFRYGKTTTNTQTVPCAETPAVIGTGTDPVPVHADVTGLVPHGTKYSFRLIASNPGQVASSSSSFKTPDTVITSPVSALTGTTATLNGSVNPDGTALTECLFEYGTTTAYGQTTPCDPDAAGIGTGVAPVPVEADLADLDPVTTYHFRLKATYDNGSDPVFGDDVSFTTRGPRIAETWSEDVAVEEAMLRAEIDPEGQTTTYRFEYGTTEAYGVETPELPVGSDSNIHTVSRFLEGLEPSTTYHFRIVATNADAVNEGPDRTFTTSSGHAGDTSCPNQVFRTGPSAFLPDCRAYEMVSPLDKNGGDIAVGIDQLGEGDKTASAYRQASLSGEKITYSSAAAFGDAIGGHWSNQYISTRDEKGWSTHSISSRRSRTVIDPAPGGNAINMNWYFYSFFQAFTPDLATAWVRDDNAVPLAPGGLNGYVNLYQRDNAADSYRALTTQGSFGRGRVDLAEDGASGGIRFLGSSSDLSQQIFAANAALTPDAKEGASTASGSKSQLYHWNSQPSNARQVLTVKATAGQYALSVEKARGVGKLTNGSAAVTDVKTASPGAPLQVGDSVSGTGVPAGTTILDAEEGTLTLSQPATATGQQVLRAKETTDPVDATAGSAAVQAELEALPSIGSGDVTVSGGPGDSAGSSPFSIEFVGSFSGKPIVALETVDLGLAGGVPSSSASIGIADPGGHLRLVSILPSGEVVSTNAFAGAKGGFKSTNTRAHALQNAVSDDGSRVFWTVTSSGNGPGAIYVRENPGEEQSALDVSGACIEPAKACTRPIAGVAGTITSDASQFYAASSDGSEVLFSHGGSDVKNLYRFDVDTEEEELVAGQVRGVSAVSNDLSRIYFVSKEALAAGAEAGQYNLYSDHDGVVGLIATVSQDDVTSPFQSQLGSPILGASLIGSHTATNSEVLPRPIQTSTRLTPDGRHLAFMSNSRALSEATAGYDNTDVLTGKPDFEVYLYDAEDDQLVCVSCKPSGDRPRGDLLRQPYSPTDRPFTGFPDLRAAASIPTHEHDNYASRVLSANGQRLFFHSGDALLPQDSNGAQDVYQWQAPGSGSCDTGDADYVPQNGGCISLISSGRDSAKSEFVDASPSGDEVFISTDQSLDPRDPGLRDIYVAKTGGGFPLPQATAPCEGEACQTPPPPPSDPTPASAAFQGPGNPQQGKPSKPRCPKGKRRVKVRSGKVRCVPKRNAKRAKRANNHRRAVR